MATYRYEGPICMFGHTVQSKWIGETSAPTEGRAKTNLANQWKRQHNRRYNTKITMPGELVKMEWRGDQNGNL